MVNVPEIFGSKVFNDKVMKERLPKDTYKALKNTVEAGDALDPSLATVIASAMKDWAIENGATHYTHWFQPMTGITAEKHDSFITPLSDGTVIMNFSGKELIKGEPDASSFPHGGLRSTFEARGYTAWDPTSFAFVKDGALCIPTAFLSYGGQVLDKKTPLMRSINALTKSTAKIVKLFSGEDSNVQITVGAEQEYFLIPEEQYNKREDLIFTGRTLFGAQPPKGQELEDHYFGNIKPKVLSFMEELDLELWKFGILAKTRHNEAAPAQHELAPIFTLVNVATDHNQLTMEVMRKVAKRHGLVCLLHEKPFAGVNGSGKHNNWSLTANNENLLSPGKKPEDNIRFLLILTAIIKAVDIHQDLLRLSVATAGNDHRLGGNEAPPAIISIFLGDELTGILESMSGETTYNGKKKDKLGAGVNTIPSFSMDTNDRNRTSPFAFTGNKFEFRMLGSSINIACPNIMINTSVADVMSEFATTLADSKDINADAIKLIKETYAKHKRIVFNGNNYSAEWTIEAERRGLLNLKTAPEALNLYDSASNIELFEKHKIYTEKEVKARQEILLENYSKLINIEGLTMKDMFLKQIYPACISYINVLSQSIEFATKLQLPAQSQKDLLTKIATITDKAFALCMSLDEKLTQAKAILGYKQHADNYRLTVIPIMQSLRTECDILETLIAKQYWPYPTYKDLLFY